MEKRTYRLYTWLVYAVLWGMVWAYPVLEETMNVVQDDSIFSWTGILHAWKGIAAFFILFLLHRLPIYRLLLHHRVRAYCISALFLLALFATCRYFCMEAPPSHRHLQEHPVPSGIRQHPEHKPFIHGEGKQHAKPEKRLEKPGPRPS